MTAAKQCKTAGFTLAELARATGESRETLSNWSTKRPIVFGALLFWAKSNLTGLNDDGRADNGKLDRDDG